MIIEENDLVQFYFGKKKLYAFIVADKVVTSEGEKVSIRLATDPDDTKLIDASDIINNYGKEPNLDELKIEVHNKEFVVPLFGTVIPYKTLLPAEEKCIKNSLEEMVSNVEDFDIYPTRLFVKYNKGKKVGCYKFNNKEEVSEITLMPEAFDKDTVQQIMYHEIAHGIWNRSLPEKLKAAWIKLYDKNMERKKISDAEIESLKNDLLESGQTIAEYAKTMEDGNILKKVVKHIKDLYNLKVSDLDILIRQSKEDIVKYWPKEGLELSEYNPFVSQYATTSAEEFFAESFMYFYMKLKLPQIVDKAIRTTLKVLNIQLSSEYEVEDAEDSED